MNANETRALVEAFIKAWIDRDPAAMSKLVTDDAVWVLPQGFRENSGRTEYVGGDEIVHQYTAQPGSLMAKLFKLETLEFTEQTLLVDGNKAAWFHVKSGDFVAGGRYSTEYVFRFTCADGKITRIVEYVDTLQVVNQLGGLPSSGQ